MGSMVNSIITGPVPGLNGLKEKPTVQNNGALPNVLAHNFLQRSRPTRFSDGRPSALALPSAARAGATRGAVGVSIGDGSSHPLGPGGTGASSGEFYELDAALTPRFQCCGVGYKDGCLETVPPREVEGWGVVLTRGHQNHRWDGGGQR